VPEGRAWRSDRLAGVFGLRGSARLRPRVAARADDLVNSRPRRRIWTVRSEAAWWDSFSNTIAKLVTNYKEMPLPPQVRSMMEVWATSVGQETFRGMFNDRDTALAAYRRRIEEVRAAIPPERLLVFDVAEGWEPLCRFRGKAVPSAPFPHQNTTQQFQARHRFASH
jgi:hypothetical protein